MKRTLFKAAVFGSAFPLTLLQVINDPAPEATTAQLDELVTRQFLSAHPFRTTAGYTFQHTLLQETIYQALIRRDRSKIHTQIAQAIECSPLWLPEERAEVLAYHYGASTLPRLAVPHLNHGREQCCPPLRLRSVD
jgi:predicted ATPase